MSPPGWVTSTSPPFNIIISNVPGPTQPIYYAGARLDGNYPLSIALDGQALNITLTNNAGNLDFGLVGCRRSVPLKINRATATLVSVGQPTTIGKVKSRRPAACFMTYR